MQTSNEITRQTIRSIVRCAYDVQKLRIQTGNRVVALLQQKKQNQKNDIQENAEIETKLLASIVKSYTSITENAAKKMVTPNTFQPYDVIETYLEYSFIKEYIALTVLEKEQFSILKRVLEEIPFYAQVLKNIDGVGPAMGGVLISEIDIYKAPIPSCLWRLAGLDVVTSDNGTTEGRSRKKEHLVKREYSAKDGTTKERDSITFNPFLKTKLIQVLGSSFLRRGKQNKYAQQYYQYKEKLNLDERHKEKTTAHKHNMAVRLMIKRFLVDLNILWRSFEGLPVAASYDAKQTTR